MDHITQFLYTEGQNTSRHCLEAYSNTFKNIFEQKPYLLNLPSRRKVNLSDKTDNIFNSKDTKSSLSPDTERLQCVLARVVNSLIDYRWVCIQAEGHVSAAVAGLKDESSVWSPVWSWTSKGLHCGSLEHTYIHLPEIQPLF